MTHRWYGTEEGIVPFFWLIQEVGCLTNICQQQAREDEAQPRKLHGQTSESSHDGEEALNSGKGQQDSTESIETGIVVALEPGNCMVR